MATGVSVSEARARLARPTRVKRRKARALWTNSRTFLMDISGAQVLKNERKAMVLSMPVRASNKYGFSATPVLLAASDGGWCGAGVGWAKKGAMNWAAS